MVKKPKKAEPAYDVVPAGFLEMQAKLERKKQKRLDKHLRRHRHDSENSDGVEAPPPAPVQAQPHILAAPEPVLPPHVLKQLQHQNQNARIGPPAKIHRNENIPKKYDQRHRRESRRAHRKLGQRTHKPGKRHSFKQNKLYKKRTKPHYHYGQSYSKAQMKANAIIPFKRGWERLVNMYDHDIPYRFVEFQKRPFVSFILDQEWRANLDDPTSFRAQIFKDRTQLERRMWLNPLKGSQKYWDYCRDKWMEKEARVGAAFGPATCIYTLWTITGDCMENGGFVFMLMYFFLTFTVSIPMMYAELTFGQYYRKGPVLTFQKIAPMFTALPYLGLAYCYLDYVVSLPRITWLFFYLFAMFRKAFPWKHCNQHWTTLLCKDPHKYNEHYVSFKHNERTPAVEYFRARVLRYWKSDYANDIAAYEPFVYYFNDPITRKTIDYSNPNKDLNGIHRYSMYEPGWIPSLDLLLCYSFLFYIVWTATKFHCTPFGRRLVATFYFALFFIGFCLVARTYTTRNEDTFPGMEWFFDVWGNRIHFAEPKAWKAAIKHAIVGCSVGSGIYMTYGSQNIFASDEIKSVALASGCTSFLVHYLVAVYFIMCHYTLRRTPGYQSNPMAFGNDTFFDIFPQTVTYHPKQGYAWFMFSFMYIGLILFTLLRAVCSLHAIKIAFCDNDKEYYDPGRDTYNWRLFKKGWRQARISWWYHSQLRKQKLMTRFLIPAAVFQIFTLTRGGHVYLYIVEAYVYKYIPVFLAMVEACSFFFFMGTMTIGYYIQMMTTWQVTMFYRVTWKLFPTLFPFIYHLHLNPQMETIEFDGMPFHDYCHYVGYAICSIPPIIMLITVVGLWATSRARGFWGKLIYENTPELDKADMLVGKRASTRLYWAQQLVVSGGLMKGKCDRPMEGPASRFGWSEIDFAVFDFFWYVCRLYKLQRNDFIMNYEFLQSLEYGSDSESEEKKKSRVEAKAKIAFEIQNEANPSKSKTDKSKSEDKNAIDKNNPTGGAQKVSSETESSSEEDSDSDEHADAEESPEENEKPKKSSSEINIASKEDNSSSEGSSNEDSSDLWRSSDSNISLGSKENVPREPDIPPKPKVTFIDEGVAKKHGHEIQNRLDEEPLPEEEEPEPVKSSSSSVTWDSDITDVVSEILPRTPFSMLPRLPSIIIEYLPNLQVERVEKLRTKTFKQQRKLWLKTVVPIDRNKLKEESTESEDTSECEVECSESSSDEHTETKAPAHAPTVAHALPPKPKTFIGPYVNPKDLKDDVSDSGSSGSGSSSSSSGSSYSSNTTATYPSSSSSSGPGSPTVSRSESSESSEEEYDEAKEYQDDYDVDDDDSYCTSSSKQSSIDDKDDKKKVQIKPEEEKEEEEDEYTGPYRRKTFKEKMTSLFHK